MRFKWSALLLALAMVAAVTLGACAKPQPAEAPAAAPAAAAPSAAVPAGDGKIPVTTANAEAKAAYLEGRATSEQLRITDSIAAYQKAATLDPSFALAELGLANTAPTGREFFDHLGKAVSLADKASDGERLTILAAQAGANNDVAKQKQYLEQLVAAYPNDERAHFALGGYEFGQQEYAPAIEHYKKATEIAPDYSPAYNLLGYALRQTGDFAGAETAFKKYIELIPKDPNPYDSYAELLLKMGRFDEAIAQYRKALEIDPNFVNSYQGVAAALMYQGKSEEAAKELETLAGKARNDGETTTALFAETVLAVDGGKTKKALDLARQQYALGEKGNDLPAMAGALQLEGIILLESEKHAEAKEAYEKALKLIDGSTLSQEIKDNAKLVEHANLARVAVRANDLATAKSEADEFRKGAEASGNPGLVRQAHEIAGIIALSEKNYDQALSELALSNQQNPYNLYRICQAHSGKGDKEKAKDFCAQAANFNSLPALNYAFIRSKAAKAAA